MQPASQSASQPFEALLLSHPPSWYVRRPE
jgi:hypothetical protein